MAPKVVAKPKREREKTRIEESEGGSAMLRNLAGKAMEKRQKRELEAAAAKEKRDALAARKTAAFRRQPTCLQHGSATARMRAPQHPATSAPALSSHAPWRR